MRANRANRLIVSAAAAAAAAAALAAIPAAVRAGAFVAPTDLLVLQSNGDGGSLQSADSVTLNEYDPATLSTTAGGATAVNTVNLPVATLSYGGSTGLGLTLPESPDHDGQLAVSQDGHQLVFGTYLAAVGGVPQPGQPAGSALVGPNNVAAAAVPRVITVLHPDGSLDDSTQLTGPADYNSLSLRQVNSLDGTQFWTAGNNGKPFAGPTAGDIGGIRFTTLGANTSASLNGGFGTDSRTVAIYQGQLYSDSGSNNSPPGEHTLSAVGGGLPTTGAPAFAPLPSPNAYANGTIFGNQSPAFVTLNNGTRVLYQSDSTDNDVEKYTLVDGAYVLDGKVAVPGVENVVAANTPAGVRVYFDTAADVYAVTDTGAGGPLAVAGQASVAPAGQTATFATPAPVLAATGNAVLRGLSFAPSASPAVGNQIWADPAGGSWATAADWADGLPNAPGATATFGPNSPGLAAPAAVTLDGDKTVGHVVFNNAAASYTVAAGTGGTLTINDSAAYATGVPSVFVTAGSHTIAAPVTLANGLTVATAYQTVLTLAGPVGGTGGLTTYGPGTLVVAAADTYAGPTVVNSGPVLVLAGGALPATTALTVGDGTDAATVTVYVPAGTAAARPVTVGSASVLADGSLVLAPSSAGGRSVLVTGGLAFAGSTNAWQGRLDLSFNDLIVRNGNLAQLTNQVATAYAGDTFAGQGVTSSAAAADARHLTAVGVIPAPAATFDGQAVTPGLDVVARYTYFGDANLDGVVDGADYARIDAGFLGNGTLTGWYNGDFNYDGKVDASDYTLIDDAFNLQTGSLGTATTAAGPAITARSTDEVASAPAPSAVPEPAGLGLLAVAVGGRLARRRNRAMPPETPAGLGRPRPARVLVRDAR